MSRRACPLLTGAWVRALERWSWTGDDAPERVPCGYVGDDVQLVCHLIATHRFALAVARPAVAGLRHREESAA